MTPGEPADRDSIAGRMDVVIVVASDGLEGHRGGVSLFVPGCVI